MNSRLHLAQIAHQRKNWHPHFLRALCMALNPCCSPWEVLPPGDIRQCLQTSQSAGRGPLKSTQWMLLNTPQCTRQLPPPSVIHLPLVSMEPQGKVLRLCLGSSFGSERAGVGVGGKGAFPDLFLVPATGNLSWLLASSVFSIHNCYISFHCKPQWKMEISSKNGGENGNAEAKDYFPW